jgi:hypothetical protein
VSGATDQQPPDLALSEAGEGDAQVRFGPPSITLPQRQRNDSEVASDKPGAGQRHASSKPEHDANGGVQ